MEEIPGLYQHLVDHSPVGTWVLDLEGTTVWFTSVLCEILGRRPDEVDGLPAGEVFDAPGQAQFGEFLARMRSRGGREPEVECLVQRPEGTAKWVMIGASTLHSDERTYLVLRVVDHDGRKSLADQLTEAQRLGKIGSWQLDLRSGESAWSEEMFNLLGRSPDLGAMSIEEFRDMVVEEDAAAFSPELAQNRFSTELRVRRPDGRIAWLRMEGRAELDGADGRPVRLMASTQDVTEQKELELQLREAGRVSAVVRGLATAANESATVASTFDLVHRRMSSVDENMRLMVFRPVADEHGMVDLVPGYPGRDTSRLTPDQLVPTPRETSIAQTAYLTREMQYDDDSSPGLVLVARALMDDVDVVAIIVLTTTRTSITKEGWREIAAASAAQVQQVLVRERTNAALAEARDVALEATRLKSEFLATMSHEIRTPMNGVIGLNDLLLRTELDANQQRLAHGVRAAGQSLLTVINDILDFSKIEAGRLELESVDFELRECLDKAIALLGERADEKGLELAMEVLPDVPAFVHGDPTRLAQVITNLVSNAVKFTSEGEVILRCAVDGPVTLTDVPLRFEVRDTGIGIAAEHQDELFDAFTQAEHSTTRNFGGTGLGLAISRQLVAALNGRIGVESERGVGSTFWFTARFTPGDAALVPRTAGATRHVLEGRRMLVVDDSASNRRILAEMLAEWQVEVESAVGAEEAVDRVRRATDRGEPFDVVILDLVMPGTNGLELATTLTGMTDGWVPTMVLLSSAQGVEQQRLRDAGIALCLTKPVGHSALFDGLIEGLAGTHGRQTVAAVSVPETGPKLGRRVLVVEDNEINQMVAQGVLQALGYESDVAADGVEGVAMAAVGRYDAIIMDVQMPHMDGYAATRLIRVEETGTDRVPIIAMTAAAIEGERERCLDAGMDAYLTKPLQPDQLEATLRLYVLQHATAQGEDPAADEETVAVEEPVLDPSRLEALREMGADAGALVERIVATFISTAEESLAGVRRAVQAADHAEIARLTHKLRGSAANLGAVQVSALCRELEEHALEAVTDDEDQLLADLERSLEVTIAMLRRQILSIPR